MAYDAAGNSAQAVSTVTVANNCDTTAPTVCITSPKAGTVVSSKSQKVTVSATDASGIAKVSLYANSTLIGTLLGNTTGTYSFTWNTSKVARGSYTLTAIATDKAGNSATSAGVAVTR